MAMIQTGSRIPFSELTTTKKGYLGEAIVDRWLIKNGFVPYIPLKEAGAHPFDKLCASKDKKRIFVVDVKTKPRRVHYPDTGINVRSYNEYLFIQARYKLDIFLFFVDEDIKKIYGNNLLKLQQPITKEYFMKVVTYPWEHNGIVYFHLESMVTIADLTDQDAIELASLSTRNEEYKKIAEQRNEI